VIRPEVDSREYRYLQLENGLRVLLVSAQGVDKAAASLDVNVGSRQDPRDYQGLAHFLEHMLFLGTEKYPDAGEYQTFIGEHGGSHNAFTSFEHTNYFFDVAVDSLEPTLDRFAQFFVAPLFNAEYVQREVNAVNSEYRAKIRSDQRRELAVFKAQLNPDHPFSKFSVGNLTTLQSDNEQGLRNQLLTFYKQYYSANLMTLTVIGRESLNDLEKMVVDKFAAVANAQRSLEEVTAPLFVEGALPQWLNIQSLKNRRALSINFPVPDAKPHWRVKPLNYIGNILGHEGSGSLLSLLKKKSWAVSLRAGESLDYQGGGLFGVDIELTEAGLAHVDDIVALVFQYIDLLRDQGVTQWRFTEQSLLAQQQFRFRSQPAPIREVVNLSMAMHQYPAAELLRGPFAMTEYSVDSITEFLQALRLDNSFIAVSAPDMAGELVVERYDTQYERRALSASVIESWNYQRDGDLQLPEANPYISTKFGLKDSRHGDNPQQLTISDNIELWLHTDDEYELPKGRIRVLLETPMAANTAEAQSQSQLWLKMVRDELNEVTYPAALAGLDYGVSVGWRGIELSIGGYNEKQSELLANVLKVLQAPDWSPSRFARIKAQRLRQLENARKNPPYQQLVAELPRVLSAPSAGLDEIETATREQTMADVKAAAAQVLDGVRYKVMLHGNYDSADAERVAAVLSTALAPSQTLPRPEQRLMLLAQGQQLQNLPIEHDDAAVLLYVQAPEQGQRARVAMGVTAQILSAEFYHQLRTEKQLGYVVNASVYPQRDVAGLFFLVQSPVVDSAVAEREVAAFIDRWLAAGVSEEAFNKHRKTLIKKLQERPDNLWQAADRQWNELLEGYTDFDSREQLVAELSVLEYAQWWSIVEASLEAAQRRSLLLYNQGKWSAVNPRGTKIPDAAAFREQQGWSVFH
ncbi:MAG: insulinase family protein, partial [Spongiibacteraceae bacterium]